MSQIPEDLIQTLMKMTGQGRAQVEQMVQGIIGRQVAETKVRSNDVGSSRKKKLYTYERYPHYLTSDHVYRYTLRVSLKDIKPVIWRKIDVPSNITLRHLGDLILDLMGWDGGHLNQFRQGNNCYLPYYQRDLSEEPDFCWGCENFNQEDYTIADLLSVKGKSVVFEYDFGDSWEHEVRLSSVNEYADGEAREIVFIGGKRECPPEDCGGVWGYEELMEILTRCKAGERLSKEEREHLDWAGWGKDYNPEDLDLGVCRIIVDEYNGK